MGCVWCQYRSHTVAMATTTIPSAAAKRHQFRRSCDSHRQALQLASNTSGRYTSRAPLDIIECIRLAISALLGAPIMRTKGPKATSTTSTKSTYRAMNVRERRSILPQSAGDAQSVGKCKQFDCFRLAEIAGRTDSHAGRVIGDWLRCYYQPVVIRDQACD